MIYRTPQSGELSAGLAELDGFREALGHRVGAAGPWLGALRRQLGASSVASSIEIEGFVEGADDSGPAFEAYTRALDHVRVMADDPSFAWGDRVILDLHFDACSFQRGARPGRWRETPVSVTAPEGGIAYEAPEASRVAPLMDEVIDWLRQGDLDVHVVVRAAMAHLHMVSVHPFRDGNGRIARIVQSLVLAREGLLSPEFASIEEHLGSHTREYYAVLREVQGGSYQPECDATAWVRFCIEAHIAQAQRRLDQLAEAAARWSVLEALVERRGWPDRLVIALEQSLTGGTDRATYEAEADVSSATASNDFRRLLDAGLIEQTGRGRATRYHAAEALRSRG